MVEGLATLLVRIIPSSTISTSTSSCSKRQIVVVSTTFLLAASVVHVAFRWLHKKKQRQLRPYPPGPKGLPFFGNLFDFPDASKGGQLDKKLLEWSKEYGLVYSLRVPLCPVIICADPAMVQHVAVTRNFHKSPLTYKHLRPVIGAQSMVTLEGKEWAAKRRSFNPGFSPAFLRTMVATMAVKLERCMACIEENIASGEPTNVLVRAQIFTSDVIVTTAFGEDWGGTHPHPARLWLSRIAELSQDVMFRPMIQLFGFWHKREIKRYERLLNDEMRAVLERRFEEEVGSPCGDSSKMDICSIAIREIKKERGTLTEQDKVSISHQLKTFYFAGHDTTAILIAWAVWLLSLQDQVLSKVRAELKRQEVWIDPTIPPTFDQLQCCTYLDAVLKETLRLYPPVGGVCRSSPDESETFNGYKIGGAIVVLSAYVMHHHPSLWKRPEDFIPERFLDGSEEGIVEKFMAFSRGPRDCIGKYFAILEAKLAVSALVTAYEMKCVDPRETIYSQLTNIPMNGAQIRFSRRVAPLQSGA